MINTRENLPDILNSKNYKIGVELGSYKGEFADLILSNWNGKLICIDLFDREDNYLLQHEDNYYTHDLAGNKLLPIFNKRMHRHKDNLLTIQSDTVSASKFFPDNYFDFIYIDADHKYEAVIQELNSWYCKLKPGGLFSGHDFLPDFDYSKKNNSIYGYLNKYNSDFGVNTAIVEFCNQHDMSFNLTNEPYWKTWYFFKP